MADFKRFQPAWNFLGIPDHLATPDKAQAWVLPIPYEATTCYGTGTREGPAAIIAASRHAEAYDIEFHCEPCLLYGVHTMKPLASLNSSPEDMTHEVEETVAAILAGSPAPRLLAVLGGEHSISGGVVRGLARSVAKNKLVAVHIDAHGDLRDEYDGSRYSHACAARRITDICPIFQIGVRSFSEAEEQFRKGNKRVTTIFSDEAMAPKAPFLKKLAAFVKGKTVYFTIDLDGLDPSIMPAVGTPEPGGLSWERTMEIADVVCRNAACIPVFDVVELAPIPAMHAPDYLTAILTYKIMSKILLLNR
jgi:agmatinase